MKWMSAMAAPHHSTLSDVIPPPGTGPARQVIFERLRDPSIPLDQPSDGDMPMIWSDIYNSAGHDSSQPLTKIQYNIMRKWKNGSFTNDKRASLRHLVWSTGPIWGFHCNHASILFQTQRFGYRIRAAAQFDGNTQKAVTAEFLWRPTFAATFMQSGMPRVRSRAMNIAAFIWRVPQTRERILRAKCPSRPLCLGLADVAACARSRTNTARFMREPVRARSSSAWISNFEKYPAKKRLGTHTTLKGNPRSCRLE
jgi:hypothetical protein